MTDVPPPALHPLEDALRYLLTETFDGPPGPGSAYLDQGVGWFPTLDGVGAAEASRAVAPGGTTVAAHVAHARVYLDALVGWIEGRPQKVDWTASFTPREVDEAAWADLRAELRAARGRVDAALEARVGAGAELGWDEDSAGGALAILAHSAYHLGAVRQILLAAGA